MRRLRLFAVGVLLFAFAAVSAAWLAVLLLTTPLPPGSASFYLLPATASALSFAVVYWCGLRAGRPSRTWRGVTLGMAVVFPAHLLLMPSLSLIVFFRELFNGRIPDVSAIFEGFVDGVLMGAMTLFAIWITLPLGIAAGLLFEWIEQRWIPVGGDEAKAVE